MSICTSEYPFVPHYATTGDIDEIIFNSVDSNCLNYAKLQLMDMGS